MVERDPILTAFHNSYKWRKFAEAFLKSKGYICERCKNKNVNPDIKPYRKQFHAHHIIPLTRENVNNPDIALNYDNLMCLCQHCHNIVTFQKDVIAPGLMFNADGEVVKIVERQTGDSAGTKGSENL